MWHINIEMAFLTMWSFILKRLTWASLGAGLRVPRVRAEVSQCHFCIMLVKARLQASPD